MTSRAAGALSRLARPPLSWLSRSVAWLVVFLRYPVILAWVGAAVYMTVAMPGLESAATGGLGGIAPRDAEALDAQRASLEQFRFPVISRTMLIERDPQGMTVPSQAKIVARDALLNVDRAGASSGIMGALPLANALPLPFAGERATAVLTYLFTAPDAGAAESTELAERLAAQRRADDLAGQVDVTGSIPAQVERGRVISQNLVWLDLATLLLVIVIVGWHFRAIAPPLVAIMAVAVAYLVSVRVVAWVAGGAGLAVSSELEPVMTVLLFGVLTDYSVFLITRFRSAIDQGEPPREAARRSLAELLPVVLTAGLVIALATGALYFAHLGFLHALGPGLAITIAVSALVALTFVPAALAVAGRRVLWPRGAAAGRRSEDERGGIGGLAVRLAAHHPVIVATATLVMLIAAGSGLLTLKTGDSQISSLEAGSEVQRGYQETGRAFVPGAVAPTLVVLEQQGIAGHRSRLAVLRRHLARQPGVAAALGPGDDSLPRALGIALSPEGDAARFVLMLRRNPLGAAAIDDVRSLRSALPRLLSQAHLDGAHALVGGDTALTADTASAIHEDLIRVAPIVLAVIFAMVALMLRALVAPLYLLAAGVLSVAAAIGLTAYFFQGMLGYGGVSLFVPLTMAVLLLSLGSDYNIFLTARIWQESRVRPLREAIVVAGARSTRAITTAGIVLAGSFAAAALIPVTSFRELAFGMVVGLLLDAFVVRTLLVPALISLVGPISGWPGRRLGAKPGPLDSPLEASGSR